jgi:hypothetical protein
MASNDAVPMLPDQIGRTGNSSRSHRPAEYLKLMTWAYFSGRSEACPSLQQCPSPLRGDALARQAGAAEYQVVLGRLARWSTDSDVLSSLVVPQRNPLPGNERVLSAGRMHGGQIQVGRDLHHPLDANHRYVEKKEKGRRALRRRPCLATAGSRVRFRCVAFHLPTSTLIRSTQRGLKPLHAGMAKPVPR